MQLSLLVSPNLLALCNYMALGKFVATQIQNKKQAELDEFHQEHAVKMASSSRLGLRCIPFLQDRHTGLLISSRISKFFLFSDVFTFVFQMMGGGMLVMASTKKLGEVIMDTALLVQIFFFAGFTLLVYTVSTSEFYNPSSDSARYARLFRCLYITIVLLTIRNVYRFIEFAAGLDGPIAKEEALFYVFDTLVMLLLFTTYFALPMARYLPLLDSIRQAQAQINKVIAADCVQFAADSHHITVKSAPEDQ